MTTGQTTDAFAPTVAPAATLVDDPRTLPGASTAATISRHGTVLPRIEARGDDVRIVHEGRTRYESERLLGEGGMGTVTLAQDHDIDRRVAVKQIRREVGARGLARFVEEVRTIGRLEHPNIIPIHDVGVDEQGNYFFVMKYVEGETLEEIIERLASGDEAAHRRFTFEARVQIFIGLLRALSYAHDRGIIHRDIKPANIMVGPYGEVVLMDWGVAKPVGKPDLPPVESAADEAPATSGTHRRLVQTVASSLVGTPAYMSPEQARGAPDLDARSDLYAASIVFHELLTLEHYLKDAQTVPGVLVGVMERSLPPVINHGAWSHPTQGPPPTEYMHFLARGTKKAPSARWGSAAEMISEVQAALDGKTRVQCPMTLTKRMTREAGRFVDRHPWLGVAGFMVSITLVLFGLAATLLSLLA